MWYIPYFLSLSISSVQFSCSVVFNSLQPCELKHAGLLSLSPIPELAHSCPLSWWCHPVNLILYCPLLLLRSVFSSIRVFFSESVLHIRWPEYWSFSFSISLSNEYSGLISFRMTGLNSLQSKGLSRVFSNTTVWKHQIFGTQPSLWSNSNIHTWLLKKP